MSRTTALPIIVFHPSSTRHEREAGTEAERVLRLERRVAQLEDMLQAETASREHERKIALEQRQVNQARYLEELRATIAALRSRWAGYERAARRLRIASAVLQGLAERSTRLEHEARRLAYFHKYLEKLTGGTAEPATVENEAVALGLPVVDATQTVAEMTAWFGYVDEIETVKGTPHARVILHDQNDQSVDVDETVPCIWLPEAYRHEGAGVAWVERSYVLGVIGRFEPASAGE